MDIDQYFSRVVELEKMTGDVKFQTHANLLAVFPEWEDLLVEESPLSKLLRSNLFKKDEAKSEDGLSEIGAFKVFGLLHCSGSLSVKAKHFL